MNDLEGELREMFRRRESDVLDATPAAAPVIRRTRRRQASIVAIAVIAVVAVVLVPLFGFGIGDGQAGLTPTGTVELPDAPAGFRAAALPYASIAYPKDWYLLDTSVSQMTVAAETEVPVPGPILQLANFDPDIPHSPRCTVDPDAIPEDGVLLTVGINTEEDPSISSAAWPARLRPFPPNLEPVCAQMHEQTSWRAPSGLVYYAQVGWGADASHGEIEAVHRAFESLRFPPTTQPWIQPLMAIQGRGTPRAVLGSTTLGDDVLTFVAYLELDRVLWVGVESNGRWGTATAPHSGSDPNEPVQAGLSIVGEDASLLHGVISPDVARVEVRTDSGEAAPMNVVPLPTSLGVSDRYVWALVPGAGARSAVVGYDRDGNPIGNPTYPVGKDRKIASGIEAGERWTLSLTHDNTGWGLAFDYGDGSGGGGGGDLGDNVFGSAGSSGPSWNAEEGWSTAPREIDGVVTSDAARIEFQLVGGESVAGDVYALPSDAFGGGASAYVIFVPNRFLVPAGDLVALDEQGRELGRQYLDFSPVFLYPKVIDESPPESVDAMKAMQLAGGVAARYFYDHGSWAGFDPAAATSISDDVDYNTSQTAIVGEISLRVADKNSLVLATKTPRGDIYSACMTDGPGGAMEGRNDTSDPSACSNGWLNPPGTD
jgi:hypothetical protein